MSTQFLTVSPSPHIHSEDSVQKLMYGVIIALLPALAISLFVFGIGAIYVTLLSVVSCVVVEFALTKYLLKKEPTIIDGSALPHQLPCALTTGVLVDAEYINPA